MGGESLFWYKGACGRKADEKSLPKIVLQFGFDCIEKMASDRISSRCKYIRAALDAIRDVLPDIS